NRRLNNVYLHGGTKTDVPPFDDIRDPLGYLLSVNYVGNNNSAPVRVSESTTVDPRTTGTENQNIADIINNIIAARDAFSQQSPAQVQLVRSQQEALENELVSSISRLGGVQYRIEVAQRQSVDRFETLETLISRDADIDYSEASVRLNRAQLAYQASIQSGARIMNNSLLDYIR
ncbi:MAG: flagellin, partial [Chthoniobacterales bacterium]|nr:flagellin [Chthoniobacterales bacterium]